MALNYELNTIAVQQFHDILINKLQQEKHKLEGTYQLVTGVVGDAYKWPFADLVDMKQRSGGPLSHIPNTNVDYSRVTTTFEEWDLKLASDKIFTQPETNINELNSFAGQHMRAIKRRQDQFIIDALNASTTTNVISDNSTNLPVTKLTEAVEMAVDNNWPEDSTWHIAIHASQLRSMLDQEKVTSSDYNTIKALVRGEVDSFCGFKFHKFGQLSTGGLPKTGDVRTCFAWFGDALGFVYSVNPETKVFPLNDDLFVPTVSYMKAGANTLLQEGVIKIECDETA